MRWNHNDTNRTCGSSAASSVTAAPAATDAASTGGLLAGEVNMLILTIGQGIAILAHCVVRQCAAFPRLHRRTTCVADPDQQRQYQRKFTDHESRPPEAIARFPWCRPRRSHRR